MDMNQGTVGGKPPRYQELLDRAGKGIEQLGVSLDMCEQKLHLVLEKNTPKESTAEIQKEPMTQCELEDMLLNLRNAIETRLYKIQSINARIRI